MRIALVAMCSLTLCVAGAAYSSEELDEYIQSDPLHAIPTTLTDEERAALSELRKERTVSVPQMLEMQKDKDTVILDVRTTMSYYDKHVKGAVTPRDLLSDPKVMAKIIPDKNTRIVTVTNDGMYKKALPLGQTKSAFETLNRLGYKNVYVLETLSKSKDPEAYEKMLTIVDGKSDMGERKYEYKE